MARWARDVGVRHLTADLDERPVSVLSEVRHGCHAGGDRSAPHVFDTKMAVLLRMATMEAALGAGVLAITAALVGSSLE